MKTNLLHKVQEGGVWVKKLFTFALLCMFALGACSEDSSNEEDRKERETTVEETSGEEPEENKEKEEDQTTDANNQVTDDPEQILRKSAEAMAGMTSFLAEGEVIENTTMNGQEEVVETTLSVKMALDEFTQMHMQMNTTSNLNGDQESEMYVGEKAMYTKSEGQWFSMPLNSDIGESFDLFKGLDGEMLEEYLDQSQWFEVKDGEDHYLLSFNGDEEQYKSVVLGASEEVLGDTLQDHFENMKISGTYEIEIDKDTYFMTGYATEYEASTSGEIGEVETYHKSNYTISNMNEYDKITVPDEVVEQAQSFQ